jgi:hypothetical protein
MCALSPFTRRQIFNGPSETIPPAGRRATGADILFHGSSIRADYGENFPFCPCEWALPGEDNRENGGSNGDEYCRF